MLTPTFIYICDSEINKNLSFSMPLQRSIARQLLAPIATTAFDSSIAAFNAIQAIFSTHNIPLNYNAETNKSGDCLYISINKSPCSHYAELLAD